MTVGLYWSLTRVLGTGLKEAMCDIQKPQVVFVLGSPGAGKGTQCKKIVKEFGYVHLSAGDLLRDERKRPGSLHGELIEKHIRNGTIVPVDITCSLLEKAMERHHNTNRFLIDGFPRDQENLRGWTKVMASKVDLRAVLFLDCPEDVSTERCLTRGTNSGRSDDNIESLRKRFDTYINDTMPVVEHYKKLQLVRRVDATRSPSLVFDDIKQVFKEFNQCTDVK